MPPATHTRLLFLLTLALIVAACTPAAPTATPVSPTPTEAPTPTPEEGPAELVPPTLGDFDPASVSDIALADYPVLPVVTDRARAIFEAGQAAGNNPHVFSKIGDCMTAAAEFLTPFGGVDYDLGQYGQLQAVVDFFAGTPARGEGFTADSFANPGLSTASGFNAASVLDPTWADPNWCRANESPLACEYRASRPAFALIMFGTNDVFYTEAPQFDYYLRSVVLETINRNIVPVLNTFPTRPEYPEKSLLFNQIVVRIAQDYDLPLINLWLALQDVPNQGVDTTQTIHLTWPEDRRTGVFTEERLVTGYTFRNLVTLQAFDALLRGLGLLDA